MNTSAYHLRHTFEPYAFRIILFVFLAGCFSIFSVLYKQMVPAVVGLCTLFYIVLKIYFYENRYSVWLDDKAIYMHPAHLWYSPALITSINYADITAVRRETSNLQTVLAATRPSRRLAIYAEKMPSPAVVDVSFKHFAYADISLLLQRLREVRPDLSLPSL
jgi:hypothetical protein